MDILDQFAALWNGFLALATISRCAQSSNEDDGRHEGRRLVWESFDSGIDVNTAPWAGLRRHHFPLEFIAGRLPRYLRLFHVTTLYIQREVACEISTNASRHVQSVVQCRQSPCGFYPWFCKLTPFSYRENPFLVE